MFKRPAPGKGAKTSTVIQSSGNITIEGDIEGLYQHVNVGEEVFKKPSPTEEEPVETPRTRKRSARKKPKEFSHRDAPLKGIGLYISDIAECEGGDILKIAERASATRLGHLVFRIVMPPLAVPGSGVPSPPGSTRGAAGTEVPALVARLRELGLESWGWQQVESAAPEEAAKLAAEWVRALDLEGYIVDIGAEFKSTEAGEKAVIFLRTLRGVLKKPIGITSYSNPFYNSTIPWQEILAEVDFVCPQIYWEQAHNPAAQTERSLYEYDQLSPRRPFFPVGSAYATADWRPTAGDLIEFIQFARDKGLNGVSLFHWDWLGKSENAEVWSALQRTYTVTAEDTLAAISSRFGVPIEALTSANDISDPNLISAGQDLTIPWVFQAEEAGAEAPEPEVEAEQTEEPPAEPMESLPPVPKPQFSRSYTPLVHNDEVARQQDLLGFDQYAASIVDTILDPKTTPPLTIGVSAAWGGGKSFLLERIVTKITERQQIYPETKGTVKVVRFNAWDYNTTEAIWPGLVRKIMNEMEGSTGLGRRLSSRTKRNLRRQWNSSRDKIIPFMGIAIAIFVVLGLIFNWDMRQLWTYLVGLGVLGIATSFAALASQPMAQWIVNLFTTGRSYGKIIDYNDEIRDDIESLVNGLPKEFKIIVVIDDLDRCSSAKIVQTLEAIKLMLGFPSFIVFLAVDAAIISRAIETENRNTLVGSHSGYFYLDKIIQIPFRIPEPEPARIIEYLNFLLKYSEKHGQIRLPAEQQRAFLDALKLAALPWPFPDRGALERVVEWLPQSDDTPVSLAGYMAFTAQGQPARRGETAGGGFDAANAAIAWGLLARYWPVSTYTMHDSLVNLPPGPDLDQPALPFLLDLLEKKSTAEIQLQQLRENSDASAEFLKNAIQAAPPSSLRQFAQMMQHWTASYTITTQFTNVELTAFRALLDFIKKNPRHMKRMVNTYALIRLLAANSRTDEGKQVLNAPEAILKWLIISSQWPLTAEVMLEEFNNELQAAGASKLPDNDNALERLYRQALARMQANPVLQKEREDLDDDPDGLHQIVVSSVTTISSSQINLLRKYAINFNPAEDLPSLKSVLPGITTTPLPPANAA